MFALEIVSAGAERIGSGSIDSVEKAAVILGFISFKELDHEKIIVFKNMHTIITPGKVFLMSDSITTTLNF